jgi:hypothetical protein
VVTNNLKDFPGTVFVQEGTLDSPRQVVRAESRDIHVEPSEMGTALDFPQFDHRPR